MTTVKNITTKYNWKISIRTWNIFRNQIINAHKQFSDFTKIIRSLTNDTIVFNLNQNEEATIRRTPSAIYLRNLNALKIGKELSRIQDNVIAGNTKNEIPVSFEDYIRSLVGIVADFEDGTEGVNFHLLKSYDSKL